MTSPIPFMGSAQGLGGVINGADFLLNFRDLGAGAVDLSADRGVVSETFTRATIATSVSAAGLIVSVSSGVARSYYSPSGTYLGYLAEGARTNKCQRSEDFANVWTDVGTPTSAAGSTLGALTLTTLGDDSAAALEGKIQTVSFTGDAVKAVSVFVKKGTSTSTTIRLRDTTAPADRLLAVITWSGTAPVVTMTTGTDLTGTPVQFGSSGVYRLSLATTSVTAANTNSLQIYPATDAALAVGGTGTIEVGGVQAEDATFQSSYIPTPASATVTRNADVLSYPLTGWFNAVEGTMFAAAQAANEAQSGAFARVASFNDTTANEEIYLGRNTTAGRFFVVDGGVAQVSSTLGTWSNGASAKLVGAYMANDFASTMDGAAVQADALGTIPTVTIMNVGGSAAGSAPLFGTISSIAYLRSRVSDGTLVALTA